MTAGTGFHAVCRRGLGALLLAALATSCSTVGPSTIANGRMAYNRAIATTDHQQMLMVAVHNRYEERSSLLSVASVTANVSVSGRAGVQAGFGAKNNYIGNLVPFSGGVIYEENPTISYVPVNGEKYMRQVSSPVPLSILVQALHSELNTAFYLQTLVSSVNELRNHAFLFDNAKPEPGFLRLVEIMDSLNKQHRLRWRSGQPRQGLSSIVIDRGTAESRVLVDELLSLAGLASSSNKDPVVIPVIEAGDANSNASLRITTRSVMQLIEIMSAAVETRPGEIENQIAVPYPAPGISGRDLRIRFAEDEPAGAYVKVEHRGGWYYIADNDLATKKILQAAGWPVGGHHVWNYGQQGGTGTHRAGQPVTVEPPYFTRCQSWPKQIKEMQPSTSRSSPLTSILDL